MDELPDPIVGKSYWHFKGTIYTVVAVAILCDGPHEGEKAVIYRKSNDTGPTFVRSLADWNRPTENGEERFTRA